MDEPHTLSEEKNYAIDPQGYLRLIDYGSSKGQKVIAEYGQKLYEQSRNLF